MLVFILIFLLLIGIINVGLRLAWGTTKFIFGLGLFWLCPVLFFLVVLCGGFSHIVLPIVIIGVLFGQGYRRI